MKKEKFTNSKKMVKLSNTIGFVSVLAHWQLML
jgi:hypothetical protein